MSCYIPRQSLSSWQMRQSIKQGILDARQVPTVSREMMLAFRSELPNYGETISNETLERALRKALSTLNQ